MSIKCFGRRRERRSSASEIRSHQPARLRPRVLMMAVKFALDALLCTPVSAFVLPFIRASPLPATRFSMAQPAERPSAADVWDYCDGDFEDAGCTLERVATLKAAEIAREEAMRRAIEGPKRFRNDYCADEDYCEGDLDSQAGVM